MHGFTLEYHRKELLYRLNESETPSPFQGAHTTTLTNPGEQHQFRRRSVIPTNSQLQSPKAHAFSSIAIAVPRAARPPTWPISPIRQTRPTCAPAANSTSAFSISRPRTEPSGATCARARACEEETNRAATPGAGETQPLARIDTFKSREVRCDPQPPQVEEILTARKHVEALAWAPLPAGRRPLVRGRGEGRARFGASRAGRERAGCGWEGSWGSGMG